MTTKKVVLGLLIPFLAYLLPILLGFAWLPVADESESLLGSNYPYEYVGRKPAISPSADPETSSQYSVPYFYEIRNFLSKGELPLWNTNVGLGMPFAAMGEGSPYSFFSLIRAFIFPHWHDLISIINFLLASIFCFLFLRELNISKNASLVATSIYVLQGAFTTTLLIPNIAQTISFFPFVFWACARLINGKNPYSLTIFIASVILVIISGHIQQAFIGLFALCIFAAVYSLSTPKNLRQRLSLFWKVSIGILLSLILSSPYLLPIYSYMNNGFHVHNIGVGLMSEHLVGINYLFDPFHFGGFRGSFIYEGRVLFFPLHYLFYFGLSFFFFVCVALINWKSWIKTNRGVLICASIGFFLLLKFFGSFFAVWIGYLPFFESFSPKHHGGIISFLLIPLAAIGVESILKTGIKLSYLIGFSFILVISMVVTLNFYGRYPDFHLTNFSLVCRLAIIAMALYLIQQNPNQISKMYAFIVLITSEMVLYLPLGSQLGQPSMMQLSLLCVGAVTAVLIAQKSKVLVFSSMVLLGLYAHIIISPTQGLSQRQPITKLPDHYVWLAEHKSTLYRTFGIQPSYSALVDIQDFGTTQPIVPHEFDFFTKVVGGPPTESLQSLWFFLYAHKSNGIGYSLQNYLKYKSTWDFFGLKYLVVNKDKCKKELNGCLKVNVHPSLVLEFKDDIARVFSSSNVLPKVFAVNTWEKTASLKNARNYFKKHAVDLLNVPPIIETFGYEIPDSKKTHYEKLLKPSTELVEYHSNRLLIKSKVETNHIIIVTDNYDKDWRVFVDGIENRLLRANATVRAVYVPEGEHTIEMVYRPTTFYIPLFLTGIIILFAIALLLFRYSPKGKRKKLFSVAEIATFNL